ncbi:unnamed protein product [Citrullus colocynthis]|uniref:Uncharacterized protein n=1 Tax=Citrullus colocynthis TaxID=252529 RepID=A0ABP0Y5W7_9ROSI
MDDEEFFWEELRRRSDGDFPAAEEVCFWDKLLNNGNFEEVLLVEPLLEKSDLEEEEEEEEEEAADSFFESFHFSSILSEIIKFYRM